MIKRLDGRLSIVGVAHVLPKSAADVGQVVASERPDVVAVELDPIRYMALTQSKRPKFLDAIRAGPNIFLLSALIYLAQEKFSRQTGVIAGEEMLVAIRHAKEVGARIQFIDQDIGVTLQRLVKKMPLMEKARLFGELVIGLLPLGKRVEIERLTDDEIVHGLLREFKRVSPTAYDVLIAERDQHMSTRLAELLLSSRRVVCVVGAGHVPGIYDKMSKLIAGEWRIKLDYNVGG